MISIDSETYYYAIQLVVLACVIYSLYIKDSSIVIVATLLLLYTIYNKSMSTDTIEPFELEKWTLIPKGNKLRIKTAVEKRFCNDDYPLTFNSQFVSNNQALVGPPNPKTLQAPIVAPPAMNWEHWSTPHSVQTAINRESGFDYERSGYGTGTRIQEEFHPVHNNTSSMLSLTPQYNTPANPSLNGNVTPTPTPQPYLNKTYLQVENNSEQLVNHHVPINYPVGKCNVNNLHTEFNKNLFTNTIQPGMYSQTFVTEPAQSNLGISFQPQFQPVQRHQTDSSVLYTYATDKPIASPKSVSLMDRSNLYDPRHTGYGSSYRAYEDTMTGRIRFAYDDVDAIAKPSYICRNNIDHWGNQYGPIPTETPTRQQTHERYTNDTLRQREELQYRYMNKYNQQVGWQRRMAPIHRRNTK